jgi:hypothetical protein
MLWIAIGQAPGLFLYAYLGTLTQHGLRLWRGQSHPHPYEYVIWIGGLAVTVVTTALLGRVALRLLQESRNSIASQSGQEDTSSESSKSSNRRTGRIAEKSGSAF